MNTHPEQWAAIYAAAPGLQLGVRCLAQGHLRGLNEGYPDIGLQLINLTPHHKKKGWEGRVWCMGDIGVKIVDAYETTSVERHTVPDDIVFHLLCIHLVFCCNDIV